jgi:hypothetical protein
MFDSLSPSGQALYMLAVALGARVTSAKRTPDENEHVGGSPTSAHLRGDAIDIAADSPPMAVKVLSVFGKGGLHTKGTAPHYHFEATPLTLALFVAGVVGIVKVLE